MKRECLKNVLSNMDIALFALYKAGGISKKVHTEEVAWEAYQLAKERFSWRLPKFREKGFPDKTPVRFALEQAKKKENGMLVVGRAGGDINRPELEGWSFTPQGAEWIKKHEQRISKALKQESPDLPKLEADQFIRRLKNDPAFIGYKRTGDLSEVSLYMFTDMLGCVPDSSKETIQQKLDRLLAIASLAKDKEIIKFLKECATKFTNISCQEGEI
ncbi:MAG: hypothetical protein WC524_00920 [Candidatus Aminicenantales bacterium]